MRKLILIRHTETEFRHTNPNSNAANDSELSQLGREQAQKVAEFMQSHAPNLILCSLYRRAQQTAEIINSKFQAPCFSSMALNEFFLREDNSGVEQTEQGLVRSLNYLNQFRADFDTIAVVSHQSLLSALMSGILNLPWSQSQKLFAALGGVQVLSYDWKAGEENWNIIDKFIP